MNPHEHISMQPIMIPVKSEKELKLVIDNIKKNAYRVNAENIS